MSAPQFTPLPKIRAGYDVYREALTKAGHDPAGFDLPLQRQVYVGASYEEARETPRDHVMFYQRMNAELLSSPTAVSESFKMYRKAQQTMLKVEYEDLLEKEAVLFDTAENLVPRIAELERELGLTYLICKMNVGGLPHDKVMRSMERFAEHVMPHFPDRTLEPAASASDPSPL